MTKSASALLAGRPPQGQAARLADYAAAVTDLDHQRVEEHDQIDVVKRPGLPRVRRP